MPGKRRNRFRTIFHPPSCLYVIGVEQYKLLGAYHTFYPSRHSKGQRSKMFGDSNSFIGCQCVRILYRIINNIYEIPNSCHPLDIADYFPERSLHLAKRSLSTIYTGSHGDFSPSMALDFFPRLLSTCLVGYVS